MAFLSRRGISKRPVIVRTCYDPEGPLRDLRSRLLYKFGTDGIVVINYKSLHSAIAKYGLTSDMVRIVEPGIDLGRFSPQRKISQDPLSFGLKRDTFVVGVVSRIRESRRLDIPLKAMQALSETYPHLQMLLVDPKVVEFSVYNALPHLITPVITDTNDVILALKWLEMQMLAKKSWAMRLLG